MTIKDTLRSNFPNTIDKEGEIFSALVANDDGTAVIESALNECIEYMKEWFSNPNIYTQTENMLQKTLHFFSYLEQFKDEKESSILNRLGAIFVRNHDLIWGTPQNLINVFKQYFENSNIYLLENTDLFEKNIIKEGDINNAAQIYWILSRAEINTNARFSGMYGIEIQNSGYAKQSINVQQNSTYFVHFFLKGSVNVEIHDMTNNRYWDNKGKQWITSKCSDLFSSDNWKPENLYFLSESAQNVEIKFISEKNETYIDYIAAYKKEPFSSFTIIVYYEGSQTIGATSLAPGKSDPTTDVEHHFTSDERYTRVNYYDQTFLTGVNAGFAKDIYQDLINYLHATGVKGYLEILYKEIIG